MEDREIRELEKAVEQIWEVARGFGLDPYPTNFEIVPATVMYEVGSYALPGRYSHWTFGKAYHRMKTMYDFGLSKIYEVVINTNPSYGFLLETNSPIQNKMVIAHVLGHVDFFKNNTYFSKTNRRMVESVSTHAQRMMEYEFKYGRKTVERFLDSVLAIEEHIDPYFFIKREVPISEEKRRDEHRRKDGRYDDLWLLDERRAHRTEDPDQQSTETEKKPRELLPEKDLLFYIMKNSPSLAPWQRDAIAMVHEEMEYFVPQMQTKIMNEGWASIWHARIMRELDLSDNEHIEFANLHSGVVSPQKGQLNPYYLGYKIYEDIERRWNEPSAEEREKFGRVGNEGREKIFEVREIENDVSFLRNYLTEELCEELDLFVFELIEEEEWTITESAGRRCAISSLQI
jgi:stage V sporulation protein R